MTIYPTEFYTQPGINFKISHKVYGFLRKCINAEINKIKEVKQNSLDLMLIVDARVVKKMRISPPVRTKRNKNIFIYMPYSIKKEKDLIAAFLTHFCEALNQFLPEYGVTEKALNKIKERCITEMVGNKKYEYKDLDLLRANK